jgi:hypothetical protein
VEQIDAGVRRRSCKELPWGCDSSEEEVGGVEGHSQQRMSIGVTDGMLIIVVQVMKDYLR